MSSARISFSLTLAPLGLVCLEWADQTGSTSHACPCSTAPAPPGWTWEKSLESPAWFCWGQLQMETSTSSLLFLHTFATKDTKNYWASQSNDQFCWTMQPNGAQRVPWETEWLMSLLKLLLEWPNWCSKSEKLLFVVCGGTKIADTQTDCQLITIKHVQTRKQSNSN